MAIGVVSIWLAAVRRQSEGPARAANMITGN
jgi:hypothetical protein